MLPRWSLPPDPVPPATDVCTTRPIFSYIPAGGETMSNAADRLKLGEAILALIEQKRAETGDPSLGFHIEQVIVDAQFRELEADILENPGAFEPWLVRRRPG